MHARYVGGKKRAVPPGPDEETEPAESGGTTLEFAPSGSADPDKVRKIVAHTVAELAACHGWTERVAYKVQLVLDELTSNIILHGRSRGLTPHIEVRIASEEDAVRIDVTDDGIAFDPHTEASVPVYERGRPVTIGGLGVHLVKQMTRVMAYRHEGGRNHLMLVIGTEREVRQTGGGAGDVPSLPRTRPRPRPR